MKKLFILFCSAITVSSVTIAEEISPSKMPTLKPANSYKNGIYCPDPYQIIRPCVKCKMELVTSPDGKRHNVNKVCLEYQNICSSEQYTHPAFQPNDNFCGEKEFFKNLPPDIKNELRAKGMLK